MKKEMTVSEFRKTPNVYPLTEGGKVLWPDGRAIPDDVILTDLKDEQ